MDTDAKLHVDPKIANHVDAALAAGFTVYAVPTTDPRPADWVAVCLEEGGPWAHIQKPTMALDDVQLDVPIKPHKEYGSAVHVDHDGSPKDAVRALRQACAEPMVTVRFLKRKRGDYSPAPKVPNLGRKSIASWPTAVKLGERGTNWQVRTRAGRLEVGDMFTVAGNPNEVMTVVHRRYSGAKVVITYTEADDHTIELDQSEMVTLAGVA